VDNYKIPANTVLIASNIAMHKKSTHYTNGNIYDPERYMNDTKTMFSSANGNIQDRDHFTFGWGRRVCPGIYLVSYIFYKSKLINLFFH
jgi:cytochrome P450